MRLDFLSYSGTESFGGCGGPKASWNKGAVYAGRWRLGNSNRRIIQEPSPSPTPRHSTIHILTCENYETLGWMNGVREEAEREIRRCLWDRLKESRGTVQSRASGFSKPYPPCKFLQVSEIVGEKLGWFLIGRIRCIWRDTYWKLVGLFKLIHNTFVFEIIDIKDIIEKASQTQPP